MDNETVIKAECKEKVVSIFRKLTMSGVLDSDKAIAKILRDYPHYFILPTPEDIANLSRSELNGEIRSRAREGVQTNRIADRIFNNVLPTIKTR